MHGQPFLALTLDGSSIPMWEESTHCSASTLGAQASGEDVVQVERKGRVEQASRLRQDVPVQRNLTLVDLADVATSSGPYSDARQVLVLIPKSATVDEEVVGGPRVETDNRVFVRTDVVLMGIRRNQDEEELETNRLLVLLPSYSRDILSADLPEVVSNHTPHVSEVEPPAGCRAAP